MSDNISTRNNNMSSLLREQDIKVAFIDWLYDKGILDDATIINEMVVANWSRRADLAVANGHLQAFEIKSDFDSLKRLDGQIETFISRFEKVTVVCAPKFTGEVTKKVATNVGVIEYKKTNRGIHFKIVQRGRISLISNKSIYINFLLKKELQLLLAKNGKKFSSESSRDELERLSDSISLSKIRGFVLNAIKSRYKKTSNDYLKAIVNSAPSSLRNLGLLSKAKQRKEGNRLSNSVLEISENSNEFYTVDIERFIKKYGETDSVMPERVLKRLIR